MSYPVYLGIHAAFIPLMARLMGLENGACGQRRMDGPGSKMVTAVPVLFDGRVAAGPTFCCKWLAVQIPVYYNPKTAETDGKWTVGLAWVIISERQDHPGRDDRTSIKKIR